MLELLCPNIELSAMRQLEDEGRLPIPLEAVIDCESIFDSLIPPETKLPTEATLIMILLQVKQMLVQGSLRALWWVDTRDMAADGLNKGLVARSVLLNVPATGIWKLLHAAAKHTETPAVLDKDR